MVMDVCFICLNHSPSWSEEHVIGEAIGGDVTILEGICHDCNSTMSNNFENKFYNSFFAQVFKAKHGIRGKRGNPPKIFKDYGVDILSGKRLRIDNDFSVELLDPTINIERNEDGHLNINAIFLNKESARKDIIKKIKREHSNYITPENIERLDKIIEKSSITAKHKRIKYQPRLALNELLLTASKAVYEMLCDTNGLEVLNIQNVESMRLAIYNGDTRYLPKSIWMLDKKEIKNLINDPVEAHYILIHKKMWLIKICDIWVGGAWKDDHTDIQFLKESESKFSFTESDSSIKLL